MPRGDLIVYFQFIRVYVLAIGFVCQIHSVPRGLQVWAGPLSGNRLAVALWNRCSETANITMKLPAVGLDESAAYSVRDLWKVKQIVSVVIR